VDILAEFGRGVVVLGLVLTVPAGAALGLCRQGQSQSPAPVRKFTGTIHRTGDQFVLNDATTHTLYQLDDQTAAGKFEDKRVTITGTLDALKNVIIIRSIAEAAT
jgi:hypothetical protein